MENPTEYTVLQQQQIEAMLRYIFPGAFMPTGDLQYSPIDSTEGDIGDLKLRYPNGCVRSVSEVVSNTIIKKAHWYMNNPREGEISRSNNRTTKQMRVLMEMAGVDNEIQWLYDEMKFIFLNFQD